MLMADPSSSPWPWLAGTAAELAVAAVGTGVAVGVVVRAVIWVGIPVMVWASVTDGAAASGGAGVMVGDGTEVEDARIPAVMVCLALPAWSAMSAVRTNCAEVGLRLGAGYIWGTFLETQHERQEQE